MSSRSLAQQRDVFPTNNRILKSARLTFVVVHIAAFRQGAHGLEQLGAEDVGQSILNGFEADEVVLIRLKLFPLEMLQVVVHDSLVLKAHHALPIKL